MKNNQQYKRYKLCFIQVHTFDIHCFYVHYFFQFGNFCPSLLNAHYSFILFACSHLPALLHVYDFNLTRRCSFDMIFARFSFLFICPAPFFLFWCFLFVSHSSTAPNQSPVLSIHPSPLLPTSPLFACDWGTVLQFFFHPAVILISCAQH